MNRVLFTTTPDVEGRRIVEYMGAVSAHSVIGTGVLTDFLTSVTDFFGRRSKATQQLLSDKQVRRGSAWLSDAGFRPRSLI